MIVGLIILLISLCWHFQFRPIIKDIAIGRAKVLSTDAVNEAVLEELSNNQDMYKDIVKLERLENGELTALISDMEKINKLKSRVGLAIQSKFSGFKDKKIQIPLGTLTGIEMISGIGPGIPMKISLTGNVSTEFKSSFHAAGINQTIYQIYLDIHTRIAIIVPGCTCAENFDTNALVSETIILGSVPKVYSNNGKLNVSSSEGES